jgi:hypothetical protein
LSAERQITIDADYNHELDNNDNFSPDDRFLVFDTRTPDGGIGASKIVAKVEIATGKITVLYEAPGPNAFGPGAAAATYNHVRDEVVFIHGPLNPTSVENQYEKHRRVGMIVAADGSAKSRFADARNTQPPYTLGALRGGTHRHEFSRDGKWIGFTYNDAVVRAYGKSIDKDLDLRTIGVTKLGHRVDVPHQGQFSKTADGFSALVVVVVPDPKPGSDEISHAAHDSWVGKDGYPTAGGGHQLARAFIGTVRDKTGDELDELFIVDIPDDVTQPGPLGPLQGTDRAFPMPPVGARQRRLTHTADSPFPGCKGIVRASHDGECIAFQMRDKSGSWQIFLMDPRGDFPRQATSIKGGVTSGVRWHPSGNAFVCLAGSKIVWTVVKPGPFFGKSIMLDDRKPDPFALVMSHDGKTIAYNRIVETAGQPVTQIFVADVPDRDADGIPDALD